MNGLYVMATASLVLGMLLLVLAWLTRRWQRIVTLVIGLFAIGSGLYSFGVGRQIERHAVQHDEMMAHLRVDSSATTVWFYEHPEQASVATNRCASGTHDA